MAARVEDEEVTEAQLHGIPLTLRASWKFGRKLYLYLRAGAWLALTALGALADQYQLVDVQSFVRSAFGDSAKLSLIVAGVSVAWIVIGHFTQGRKGFSAKSNLDEGE
jgi:hypothetical protein